MNRYGFAKYSVTAELASGAEHFRTFLAVRNADGREVELRLSRTALRKDSPCAVVFIRELGVLRSLKHPNLLDVLDAGRFGEHLYYVTSHRQAVSLDELLERVGGPLQADEIVEVAEGVSSALACLHGNGLVLRNLSTSTVFFDLERQLAYIADLSAVAGSGVAAERVQAFTRELLPPTPEHFLGRPFLPATDLFLLGVLLYRLATGHNPFPRIMAPKGSEVESLFEAAPPSARNPQIPGPLDAVISTLLSPRSEERFETAAEFLARLRKTHRKVSMTSLIGSNRREIIDRVRRHLAERRKEAMEAERSRREAEEARARKEAERRERIALEKTRAESRRRILVLASGAVMVGLVLLLGAAVLPELLGPGRGCSPAVADKRRRAVVLSQQVYRLASAIDESPVNERNFKCRLSLLRAYLESSSGGAEGEGVPSSARLSSPGPERLDEIERLFAEDPKTASKELGKLYLDLRRHRVQNRPRR